jgi:hypothetical protein
MRSERKKEKREEMKSVTHPPRARWVWGAGHVGVGGPGGARAMWVWGAGHVGHHKVWWHTHVPTSTTSVAIVGRVHDATANPFHFKPQHAEKCAW